MLDTKPEVIYNAVFKNLKNGDQRYKHLVNEWRRQRKLLKITSFLVKFGISRKNVMKINEEIPIEYDDLGAVIRDNPYYLMNVPGVHIDINVCDEIAKRIHYPLDSPERIKAGMKYVLRAAMQSGNMFLYSSGKKDLWNWFQNKFMLKVLRLLLYLTNDPRALFSNRINPLEITEYIWTMLTNGR